MRFLTEPECRTWALQRKYPLGERPYTVLADAPRFSCVSFTIPGDAGARVALARAAWYSVGSGQPETMLWVTDWSVWPSSEHMPLAASMRRGLGEERSIQEAPGCIAMLGEDDQALSVLITAVLFLWDCWLLSTNGRLAVFFSHDECGTVCSRDDIPDDLLRSLETLQVL